MPGDDDDDSPGSANDARIAYRQAMKIFLIVLLIAAIALGLIGFIIETLFWLAVIGIVLFLLTAAYWWFKLRSSGSKDVGTAR